MAIWPVGILEFAGKAMENKPLRQMGVLLEAIKFSHSVFALPFALFAIILAGWTWPAWGKLALVVACMVLVRSVAMSYNRLVDQEIDKHNPRTRGRALPAGRLTRRTLWAVLIAGTLGAMLGCLGFGWLYNNWYPAVLLIPLIVYVCGYSHTKRFTWSCHYWLGSVLGLSVPAGFLAVDPSSVSAGAAVLGLGVCLWTAGFDMIYSLLDVDYDRREGIHSIPACFGVSTGLWVSRMTHVGAFVCFVFGGWYFGLGHFYAVGLAAGGGLLVFEHWLVRPDDFSRVNTAFFTINGALSIFLCGMGIVDVVLMNTK